MSKIYLKLKQNLSAAHSIPCREVINHLKLITLADINDCSPNPCQNGGICTDEVNNYKCSCVAGYTGYNCSIGTFLNTRAYFVFGQLEEILKGRLSFKADFLCRHKFVFFAVTRYRRLFYKPLSKWWNMYGWSEQLHVFLCSGIHWE